MRTALVALVLLLGLLSGGPARAFGNCLDAGYLCAFVTGLPPQPCDDAYDTSIRASGSTATLRVIQLSAAGRDPIDPWIPRVEEMAAAVARATDAIGTGRLPREITVLLTPGTDAEGAHADTSRLRGGECRIVFYKLPDGASDDEFTFTLAHEIFHCIQFETWRAAYVDEAGWRVAGSAYQGGGWVLTFAADGTGSIEYDGYADTCTSTMGEGQIQMENIRNGATAFRSRVSGPGAAKLEYLGHTMTQSMQVKVGPMVQDMSGSYPGPATDLTGMAFTCARNTLSVTGMFDLIYNQATHTRLPPAAP